MPPPPSPPPPRYYGRPQVRPSESWEAARSNEAPPRAPSTFFLAREEPAAPPAGGRPGRSLGAGRPSGGPGGRPLELSRGGSLGAACNLTRGDPPRVHPLRPPAGAAPARNLTRNARLESPAGPRTWVRVTVLSTEDSRLGQPEPRAMSPTTTSPVTRHVKQR